MKKIAILILNILVFSSLLSQNKYADIKIIESNSNYIIIEYIPQFDSLKNINGEGEEFSLLRFSNYFSPGIKKSGYPDIASRNITLGLPALEGNSVEIVSNSYETIKNLNFAPVVTYIKSDDSVRTGKYVKNEKIYRSNDFYPSNIAELFNIGVARDNILGTLKIHPLQYNPLTKELRKFTRIRVKVIFGLKKSVSVTITNSVKNGGSLLRSLILNYDQASSWTYIQPYNKINVIKNSVLNSGTWYKIEVKEDGIYKLDANFFKNAGISLSGVDPQTVKIYGNGGGELPENPLAKAPDDLVECAVYASGEGDGTFNDTDYFLFYGQGPDRWVYDSTVKKFRHLINHYSTSNYYFITFGGSDKGKRVSTFASESSASPVVVSNLPGKGFIEPEKSNVALSGRQWYGQELIYAFPSTSYLSPKIDGILSSEPVQYRFVCGAASNDQSYFKMEQNGQLLGNVYVYYPLRSADQKLEISDTTEFSKITSITDGKINLKVTYAPNSNSDAGYFDWVEYFYKRGLNTSIDEINFTTADTNSVNEYNLSGFSNSNILVFDVSDQNNIKQLSNGSVNAGNIKFQLRSKAGTLTEIFVVGNNGFKSPVSTAKVSNSNLHGYAAGAEYIVISPNDQNFLSQAERYKTFREASKKNPLKTYVANLEFIQNEFSSGKQDPTAIRNFLKYAYNNWTIKPKYVLLLGDGSYDYKNILSSSNPSQLNRITVYELMESNNDIDSYVTDDYYAKIIGNDDRCDLGIGRIPAITKQDVTSVIDKCISYENAPMTSWRNLLTFVADDGIRSNGEEDGSQFTDDSETLAEYYSPKQFNKNKIFIVNYKTIVTSAGRTKPDANIDIIKAFNNGTLMMNYIGHGNPRLWAHESIMLNQTTIPAVNNKDMYPFLVAATCDFGRYDNPVEQSGTELFLLKENAGTIGVFSASRSVYALANFEINREFITALFSRTQNMPFPSFGDVIYFIKQENFLDNDTKFHLFGDPGLIINAPFNISTIDTINGKSGDDTIRLKALSKVNLKGVVQGSLSEINKSYNGKVQISVYDAPKIIEITEGSGYFKFEQPGGIIYNGECTITNGRFQSQFYIPKDISYENRNGKISMYFFNSENDGYGYNSNIIIGGTDTSSVTDVTGPVINTYLNDRNFRSGDLVGSNPLLLVDLYDESGINTTGLGVGHRFEAFVDNSTEGITLNAFYKGKTDSYSEGTAEYKIDNLSNGNHKLKIKVYDIFNNPASSDISFKVQSQQSLSVMNVMNYPNPFSKSTKFTFQQNQDEPVDVTIKVYTIAGSLIKVLNEYGITSKFVQIEWDGRDEDGDGIANGVYLYKVITKTQNGKFTEESFGKLSVLK